MLRKPSEDFVPVETQDTTIAGMVIGATKRLMQTPDDGRILRKYVGMIGSIRYYAAALDNFCACNADSLVSILGDYDIAGAVGSDYLVAEDGTTIYDVIESVLLASPLPRADFDAIHGR